MDLLITRFEMFLTDKSKNRSYIENLRHLRTPAEFFSEAMVYWSEDIVAEFFSFYRGYTDSKFMTLYMCSPDGVEQFKKSLVQVLKVRRRDLTEDVIHKLMEMFLVKFHQHPGETSNISGWVHNSVMLFVNDRKKDIYQVLNSVGISLPKEHNGNTVKLADIVMQESPLTNLDLEAGIDFSKVMNSMELFTSVNGAGYFRHAGQITYDLITYFQRRKMEGLKRFLIEPRGSGVEGTTSNYISGSIALTQPIVTESYVDNDAVEGNRMIKKTMTSVEIALAKIETSVAGIDKVVDYFEGKTDIKTMDELYKSVINAEVMALDNRKDVFTPLIQSIRNKTKLNPKKLFEIYFTGIHDAYILFKWMEKNNKNIFELNPASLHTKTLSTKYDNLEEFIKGFDYTLETMLSSRIPTSPMKGVDSLVEEMKENYVFATTNDLNLHVPLQELIDALYKGEPSKKKLDYSKSNVFLDDSTTLVYPTLAATNIVLSELSKIAGMDFKPIADNKGNALNSNYKEVLEEVSKGIQEGRYEDEELEGAFIERLSQVFIRSKGEVKKIDKISCALRVVQLTSDVFYDLIELMNSMKNEVTDIFLADVIKDKRRLIALLQDTNQETLMEYQNKSYKYYAFDGDEHKVRTQSVEILKTLVTSDNSASNTKAEENDNNALSVQALLVIADQMSDRVVEKYPNLFVVGGVSIEEKRKFESFLEAYKQLSTRARKKIIVDGWSDKTKLPVTKKTNNVEEIYMVLNEERVHVNTISINLITLESTIGIV